MEKLIAIQKLDAKIRKGFLFALILLIVSYLISIYNNKTVIYQQRIVAHTYEVINTLESYLTSITDAETATRGFVITGNPALLEPYTKSFDKIKRYENKLKDLLIDNQEQLANWKILSRLGYKRIEVLTTGINFYKATNKKITDSLLKLSPISISYMDSVRSQVALMQGIEHQLLYERKAASEKYLHWLDIITFISLSLALAFIAFGFLTYQKEHKERKAAYKRIHDYQNQLNSQVAELNNINSELVKMRSQEKFAATGRMARQIAHEIRNPLTNINLAVNQLKTDLKISDDDNLYLFEMITRNSERINHLVSDLLSSTKFAELNFSSCNVNDILDEALLDAKDRIDLHNVSIVKKYDANLPFLNLDKEKIKTVFTNLIINAIEAGESISNPTVYLTTKNNITSIDIDIRDNGIGLSEENLNKIFEPYFTTKQQGNGLGLTNTQNIILNHKGQISVSSKINYGTTFNILLPKK
jgi:signal transduction histidine kinase